MTTRKYLLTLPLVLGVLLTLALLWLIDGLFTDAVVSPPGTRLAKRPLSIAIPVRYVAATGADDGDCTDSASPCQSVQYAVDQADKGDIVKVASGVYPDVHARSAPVGYPALPGATVTQVVYVSKTVTIRGGYTTANGFADPPDPALNATTLDAQGRGRVLYVSGGPSLSSRQAISPTLEGLRITGGDAGGLGGHATGGATYDGGGGVYVLTAAVTLSGNQVFSNTASAGGGAYLYNSDSLLDGNVVTANVASDGGGLYLSNSAATLRGNTVAANVAHWAGGGLYLLHSAATLDGNTVASNVGHFSGGLHLNDSDAALSGNAVISNTGGAGGGLYVEWSAVALDGNSVIANGASRGGGLFLGFSDLTLTNDVIADNQASVEGSGLYALGSSARMLHATVARNGSTELAAGSGVHAVASFHGDPSAVVLTNTILVSHTVGITVAAGNTATLEATLWGAGAWANAANWGGDGVVFTGTLQVHGDPAFVNPDAGDYHVGLASAAVDQGVNAGVDDDADGDPRPLGNGYDIGADETGLIVVKRASPDPVQAGAQLTYTIYVTNASDADLHVAITDTLPLFITPGQTAIVPGGTAIIPGGQITWTANITAPRGIWTHAFVVTIEERYAGPLTNVVQVAADKGATGIYTETCTVFIPRPVYLPIILRDRPGMITLVGEYLLVGNPCITDPCSPGMAYAVSVDGMHYYLTVEGAWLWWNRPWNGNTPQVGEMVTVGGYVDDMVDIFGAPFYNIEVVSLEPAPPPPAATWNICIAEVHCGGEYVEICNDDTRPVQLNGWTLRNAGSQQVFTFPDHLMQPGQVCRVYTNEDHPEWCGFSYGSEASVWNHVEDCAYLRDGEGTLVDAHCYCQSHTSHMTIAATAATLQVGEAVTVTVTLFNDGCVGLGMPQYRLYVRSDEPGPIFDPGALEPVVHYLAVAPGQSDAVEFVLQAVGTGQARLNASASFEVHLGYPGPAYWGYDSTHPLTMTVTP